MIQNILSRWMSSDWAIMSEAWEARVIQLKAYLSGELPKRFESAIPERPTHDLWGNAIPQPRVERGVAIVPVFGELVKGATPFEKMVFGSASYEDVKYDMKQAHAKHLPILMHFDSPGGMVRGNEETSSLIEEIAKERTVIAYTEDLMASAAYRMAAPASSIFVSPSSRSGSVGTILTLASMSRMLESMGIDVELITSGKFKGLGHPAKEITDEDRALMQEMVDEQGNQFRMFVSEHRNIDTDDMQGQAFTGREAVKRGFADYTASSLEDVLDLFGG